MKSLTFAACAVIGAQAFGWNPFKSEVTLAENGVAKAQIVLQEVPTTSARFGAIELQRHLKVMTGAELTIVSEGKRDEDLYPICIGFGKAAADLGRQEYVVDVDGDRTILFGLDDPATNAMKVVYTNDVLIAAAKGTPSRWNDHGSLNAVYDFLHTECGVRWLDASDFGTVLPKRPVLTVKKGSRTVQPFAFCRDTDADTSQWKRYMKLPEQVLGVDAFEESYFPYAWGTGKNARDGHIRLQKAVWLLRARTGGEKLHANHSFYWCYDRFWDKSEKNKRFVSYHPEYFARYRKRKAETRQEAAADGETVFEGYDTTKRPAQMCFSNPGFIRQTVEDVRAYFDAGGYTNRYWNQPYSASAAHPVPSWGKDTYCLEPMDNSAFCECPDCLKQYEPERKRESSQHSTYVFRFVNTIAKEIKKSHPKCKISTLAYMTHLGLPTGFRMEDNVVVHFCWSGNRKPNCLRQNENQTGLMKTWRAAYPDNPFGLWLYNGFPRESSQWYGYLSFPGYFSKLFAQEYRMLKDLKMRECIFNCGMDDDFESYCSSRWTWNPDEPLETLKNDFFSSYGAAEKPIRAFYDLVEERFCSPEAWGNKQTHMNNLYAWGYLGTEEVMDRLAGYMKEAEAAPGLTAQQRGRVRTWRTGVWDYMTQAKYMKSPRESKREGVKVTRTIWNYAMAKDFGPSQIEGRPFVVTSLDGKNCVAYYTKEKDSTAKSCLGLTRPGKTVARGFFDSGSSNMLMRCNGPVENLAAVRITMPGSSQRGRFDATLVGWVGDEKVVLYPGYVETERFCGETIKGICEGCVTYDFAFAPGVAPKHLDAIGIEDRTQEHKGWYGPRYYKIEVR